MFPTRRGSTTLVGFQTHHGKIIFRGTRTQYSQERSTTTLPRPAVQTTAFSQLVAEATSRRSVGKLTTPTRAHRDLQLKPHTSHHVCDVHYKGYVTSRHSHFDGRHANASESQAPSNRTCIYHGDGQRRDSLNQNHPIPWPWEEREQPHRRKPQRQQLTNSEQIVTYLINCPNANVDINYESSKLRQNSYPKR